MSQFTIIQQICIWVLPVLLAITLHEAAHAYVAYLCGDSTAKMFGRLSLNPVKHIDPIGTVAVPLLVGVLTNFSFLFGYAKPVPINPSQFRHPRRDTLLVAIAGPLSNLIMAFLWAICVKIGMMMHPQSSMVGLFLAVSGQAGILINLVLAILNLVPIPPLDGSRVLASLLPFRLAIAYNKMEPFGFIIVLLLLVSGVLGKIMLPFINYGYNFLTSLFSL